MLNTLRQCRDFSRMLESRKREGRRREVMEEVREMRASRAIDDNWSIRSVFEEVVPGGRNILDEMRRNRSNRGGVFMEAGGDAVSTTDFSDIIGQITYSDIFERFEMPELIGRQLVRERPAATQQQEIVPGVTMIGDKAQAVGENEEYPVVGLGAQWVVMPSMVKTGFMLPVTEEAVMEDKTGQLMENANQASEWLAINQEKERLNVALGITTSFRWKNEAAQATYADTHTGFTLDNLVASNALADFTDLDNVKDAFNDMTDPSTGEPVMMSGQLDLVVPDPLETTALRILNSIEVRSGDITSGTGIQTITGNPVTMGRLRYRLLTSQYVSVITSSDTTWFAGKFSEAFEERVLWPLQMFVEDRTSSKGFERDWITRVKVRRKSVPGVRRPWKVVKNTA